MRVRVGVRVRVRLRVRVRVRVRVLQHGLLRQLKRHWRRAGEPLELRSRACQHAQRLAAQRRDHGLQPRHGRRTAEQVRVGVRVRVRVLGVGVGVGVRVIGLGLGSGSTLTP